MLGKRGLHVEGQTIFFGPRRGSLEASWPTKWMCTKLGWFLYLKKVAHEIFFSIRCWMSHFALIEHKDEWNGPVHSCRDRLNSKQRQIRPNTICMCVTCVCVALLAGLSSLRQRLLVLCTMCACAVRCTFAFAFAKWTHNTAQTYDTVRILQLLCDALLTLCMVMH